MGLRGPLPNLTRTDPARLADLTPPDWLGDDARQHWRTHAPHLAADGLLTVHTAEAFAVLCDLWGRVRQMAGADTTRSYLDTVKAYQSAAKLFRLVPCDKPGTPPTARHDKPEFEF